MTLFGLTSLSARPRAPLPNEALDGGIIGAATLGRGGTIASNRPTLASGSENPAALDANTANAAYTTVLVNTSSTLPEDIAEASDPLSGKVLQYLSIGSDRGVIFFEPLARRNERQITDTTSPTTDFRDVKYSANAIGFAGATKWGAGGIGLSLAYLNSNLATTEHAAGKPDDSTLDTADGLRLNLGVRFPTGPAMWGLVIQNMPGLLWGDHYRQQNLPLRVRVGNTYRILPGFLLSFDAEKRFYREGSDKENFFYAGNELYASKTLMLRAGIFGTSLNDPDKRHVTAGLTIIAPTGLELTYAYEHFVQDSEAINRSLISVQLPFESSVEEGRSLR